jgi:glucose/arabinose dehydrogenase
MNKILIIFYALGFASLSLAFDVTITSDNQKITATTLANFDDTPWGMDFIDDNKLLITLKKGQLIILDLQTKQQQTVTGAPQVIVAGQGGLLDVQLSPDFATTSKIYLSYAKEVKDGKTTALAMAILKNNTLLELKEIFVAKTDSNKGEHFGSRIAFDQQGHIFLSIGDRGYRERAQDLKMHNGKIIRLKLDGSIPQDNPFITQKEAMPEIWSYGHRNPQGLAISPLNGELYEQEHGPRGGDEINLIKKGANYGWPDITYGKEYWGPSIGKGHVAPGIEAPLKFFIPSIAPCGLLIYSGKHFKQWRGDFFSGALVLKHLNRLDMSDNAKSPVVMKEVRMFEDQNQRIRNVIEAPNGHLIVATDTGKIIELK